MQPLTTPPPSSRVAPFILYSKSTPQDPLVFICTRCPFCAAPTRHPAARWINESIEALVLQKFGAEIWEKVRAEAKCTVPVGGFIRHEVYDDALTYALAIAVSKVHCERPR